MKLIDANALKAELEIMPIDIGYGDIDRALQVVESQPEAVVRCKDCKYCKVYDDIPWCDRLTGTFRVEEESFCSFGRKENR